MGTWNYLTIPYLKNIVTFKEVLFDHKNLYSCLPVFLLIVIFQMQYGRKHILSVLLHDSSETEFATLIKRGGFDSLYLWFIYVTFCAYSLINNLLLLLSTKAIEFWILWAGKGVEASEVVKSVLKWVLRSKRLIFFGLWPMEKKKPNLFVSG